MSKSLFFTRKIHKLDEKINSCINEITNLFNTVQDENSNSTSSGKYDDQSDDFYSVVNKLILLLENYPASCELLFPHFEELQKENCVYLLKNLYSKVPKSETNITHTKSDSVISKTLQSWRKICNHLETYNYKIIQENYSPSYSYFNLWLQKSFATQLVNIFGSESAAIKHGAYRKHFIKKYCCVCLLTDTCFNCILDICSLCISEDKFLVCVGCYHPQIITQSDILSSYNDTATGNLQSLVESLELKLLRDRELTQDVLCVLKNFKNYHIKYSGSCFSCFMWTFIDSDIEAALHCIENNYETESLWNMIFVNALMGIVDAISMFEIKMRTLFDKEENMNEIFHLHLEGTGHLDESTKFVLASKSPVQSPLNKLCKQSSLSSTDNETLFSLKTWRMIFVENGFLSILQKSLQNEIENIIKTLILKERRILKCKKWDELLMTDENFYLPSSSIQTNSLLHSVLSTVQVLEKYLPVFSTKCDSFKSFKSSYSHCIETYLVDLVNHLEGIAKQTDTGCVLYFKYIALNNVLFLKGRLEEYHKFFIGELSPNCVLSKLDRLANELLNSVFLHHFQYISCNIMFDADSCNYEDNKAFYENERISYCIPMWNLYMKGVFHDLIFFLSQEIAHKLYLDVMCSSLECFVLQFSSVEPSEARTIQVQKDIHCLLLCSSDLLWSACKSVQHYSGKRCQTDKCEMASTIDKIHSSCCLLLVILSVLSSPLDKLHGIFKNGFPQVPLSLRTKYDCVSPWLPWMRKELFSEFCGKQVISKVAVWLAVRANTTYDLPDAAILVKAFTEYNCTLSILLMMQADDLNDAADSKIHFAHSIFELLIAYGDCNYLMDILLPLIEKSNHWFEFDKSSTKKLSERSWWYIALYKSIKPYFENVYEEMIPVWFEILQKKKCSSALQSWNEVKEPLKHHLICLCDKDPLNSFQDEFTLSEETFSFVCLKRSLESLHRNLLLIPYCIKGFLSSLNKHIVDHVPEVQPLFHSVALQIILANWSMHLRECEVSSKESSNMLEMSKLTCQAFESLFENTDLTDEDKKLSKIKTILSSIYENMQVSDKEFEVSTKPICTEISDEMLKLTANKLLQKSKGEEIISYLHQVLLQNEIWIQENLGITGMLSSNISSEVVNPSPIRNLQIESGASTDFTESVEFVQDKGTSFRTKSDKDEFVTFSKDVKSRPTLNLKVCHRAERTCFSFNPLDHFDVLGETTFTELGKKSVSFNWESLLSHLPILGLSGSGFCKLFSHRWDVKQEDSLSDEETKFIEELKDVYKIYD